MSCTVCSGRGSIVQKPGWEDYPRWGYWYPRRIACPECHGTGVAPPIQHVCYCRSTDGQCHEYPVRA